jgi:hypothetical protein
MPATPSDPRFTSPTASTQLQVCVDILNTKVNKEVFGGGVLTRFEGQRAGKCAWWLCERRIERRIERNIGACVVLYLLAFGENPCTILWRRANHFDVNRGELT